MMREVPNFWRKESLRFHDEDLRVPVYIFGGQLDGYRDTVPRLLQYARVPVKAEMGPYPHAFPTDGVPGPRYEWRLDAIRWYLRWLHGEQNGIDLEPRFNIFVRKGDPPDPELKEASGQWRSEDWPIARTQWTPYFPASGRSLETAASGQRFWTI